VKTRICVLPIFDRPNKVQKLSFGASNAISGCMYGEGTTEIAAMKLKRQFLGVDIDEDECRNADINIRSFQEKLRQKQEESSQ